MTASGILGAIVVGLVVGALGRLVVPGRQPIGCLLTLLIGVVGALAGAAIARSAGVTWWLLVLACQVGVAAVGVAVVAAALRGPRRRPPRLP
ncbi:MAG: hypothetical protein QOI54_1172 [Actinomycetota bacterium]|jgi:uncharacterized membrane protein YeaQ/YmgE (transglycosylase-associated protein family)|nr:hypothetical protein [Actinomycetota bacterium]